MELEKYIKDKLKQKEILLMTHIVLGYPSLEESYRIIETMVNAGVDIMELQIPFSEPSADGPVIVRANQMALEKGTTVEACLDMAKNAAADFNIPFLIMTYYNIPFKFGVQKFASFLNRSGIKGTIIPDLPPEEGKEYHDVLKDHGLSPIMMFSPTTSDERMKYLSSFGSGFIYCVARKGVTGIDTNFTDEISSYLGRCRMATGLPLALGFGIRKKEDVDFLKEKADIAVIGTQSIKVMEEKGIEAIGDFIRELR